MACPPSVSPRLKSLDFLRLVLCLLVMFTHARRMFGIDVPAWLTKGLFDAKGGVVLFFVLSGHVLTKTLMHIPVSWDGYRQFVIKRAFRLFPLYWAALLLAFVVLLWIKMEAGGADADAKLGYLRLAGPCWEQWLLHSALLIPGMDSDFALPTVWSLMTEAKISILAFPFFGWFILRLPASAASGTVAALVVGSGYLNQHLFGTAAYLGIFGIGALLARVPEKQWRSMNTIGWWGLMAAGAGLYACMSLRYLMPSIWMGYYACALGAALIIAAVSHWPALSHCLHQLYSTFDVDLSFGIYMLHYPVLLAFFKLAGGIKGAGSMGGALLAMCMTVFLAWVLAWTVEIPMIKFGRKLAGPRLKAVTGCDDMSIPTA